MVQIEPGEVGHDQWVPFLTEFSKAHAGEPVLVRVAVTVGSVPTAAICTGAAGVAQRPSSDEPFYPVPVRHAASPTLQAAASAAVVRFTAHPVALPADA